MYIKIINEIPTLYSYSQLLKDNPQVSFPKDISSGILETYNLYPLTIETIPTVDDKTHYAKRTDPYQDANGEWRISYTIEQKPLSQSEESIRKERTRLLSETDWVITKYIERKENIPQEWLDYRQELRDIPQQTGFPWNVTWPTIPTIFSITGPSTPQEPSPPPNII